jgi:hypothetical protein
MDEMASIGLSSVVAAPEFTAVNSVFHRNQQFFRNLLRVLVAAKSSSEQYPGCSGIFEDVIKKAATVSICSGCMSFYGVEEKDIFPGIKQADPDLVGNALFRNNTKTLSW